MISKYIDTYIVIYNIENLEVFLTFLKFNISNNYEKLGVFCIHTYYSPLMLIPPRCTLC